MPAVAAAILGAVVIGCGDGGADPAAAPVVEPPETNTPVDDLDTRLPDDDLPDREREQRTDPQQDDDDHDQGENPAPEDDAPADDEATAGEDADRWGPLAVFRVHVSEGAGFGSYTARVGVGTLRIGEDCVTLETDYGETVMLFWREREVDWDPQTRRIVFDGQHSLEDGDRIGVGGSGARPDADGEPDWVAEPHDDCTGDRSGTVHSARMEDESD